MPPSMVLVVGLVALTGAVLVLALALTGAREGAGVARLLESVPRPDAATFVAPRDRPLAERLGAPLTRRLGRLGTLMTPSGAVARLQRHLDYAGNPAALPLSRVVPLKGVTLVAGALVGAGFCGLLGGAGGTLIGGVAGAACGFLGPDLMIYNLALKRQRELLLSMPDVLDTLVISVEAGLAFDAAMAQVASHVRTPLARELLRVLQEMQLGVSRAAALRALAARTTVPELRTFVTAVVQAGELGIPIAGVLREHAREMRVKRRQRAEELAQKVPIKILFPVLFCLFPALFVVILGPGVLQIIHAFAR
ncbi:type II secretion system F family protein [Krasilnikovia sp. MM14-A1259]|uniref:type II secretion system F family protein n=1 Tax=Krasilnikovia sp. MM14-A1259 TaxID=3373539 RepID=UPI00382121A2